MRNRTEDKMKITLIRHGMTKGNEEKRYIGTTDEDLSPSGVRALLEAKEAGRYPKADLLYISPMRRCVQTAGLLYPGMEFCPVSAWKECSFGLFEGKNYLELSGCKEYREWIDSGGTLPFPGGEDRAHFKERCVGEFLHVMNRAAAKWNQELKQVQKSLVMIAHGGTIMAVMEALGEPKGDYFDYQCANGGGFECVVQTDGGGGEGVVQAEGSDGWQLKIVRKL
ncbi:histidine phosphatase family protein [Diplocloster modestus]|nr:histidine phosphatase family protein [Diplocloster modestus]